MPAVLVTYMEMHRAPDGSPKKAPRPDTSLELVKKIPVEEYLRLYRLIGAQWNWSERIRLDVQSVARIIDDPLVDIWLLLCSGEIAGLGELDRRQENEIEIKYFGLAGNFIGQGLGAYFLDQIVRIAWLNKPDRLWLHTDTDDHPRAIGSYKRAGFSIFKEQLELVPDQPTPQLPA